MKLNATSNRNLLRTRYGAERRPEKRAFTRREKDIRRRYFALFVLMATLLFTGTFGAETTSEKKTTVESYCGKFADKYATRKLHKLQSDSVRVKTRNIAAEKFFNRLQPAGSRFLAGFRCGFATTSPGGKRVEFSVELYLVETREFAEHTQWKDLQIIPIERVTDLATGNSGYAVFKYLKEKGS